MCHPVSRMDLFRSDWALTLLPGEKVVVEKLIYTFNSYHDFAEEVKYKNEKFAHTGHATGG